MLAILLAGIATGSVYGLIAVGLVLTYKTSGIFNFAYGALGTVAAYAFYTINEEWHLPVVVAVLLSVGVVGCLLGLALETLARHVSQASLAVQIAATIGLLLAVEAAAELVFGVNGLPFPQFLPQGSLSIADVPVSDSDCVMFVVSVLAAAGLAIFLKRTRWGVGMRAVVDNGDLLAISGTSPRAVRRAAWIIGTVLGSVSALLLAPGVGLDATVLTSLITFGFGAAAIGGFRSLSLSWLGGIVIGVPQALITYYVSSTSILGSVAASLPYLVLLAAMLLYPKRAHRVTAASRPKVMTPAAPARPGVQVGTATIVLAFLVLVPFFAGSAITAWSVTLALLLLLLSLGLLVRLSGQISLCHMTFAAIGAVAFSKGITDLHLPWLIAILGAGLVVVPIGLLLAVPAIRLSGLYLALGTLGFGLTVQNMFYQSSLMFGTSGTGLSMPAPKIFGFSFASASATYYLLLAFAALAAIAVVALTRSRSGRLFRALSDSPRGLEALGTSATATRLVVFAVSAFLAGIAGALLGVAYSSVNALSYEPTLSLLYLVLIVIVFGGAPWYAIVAAIGVGVVPTYLTFGTLPYYLQIVFGLSALAVGYGLNVHGPPFVTRWLSGNARSSLSSTAVAGTGVNLRPSLRAEGAERGERGSEASEHDDRRIRVETTRLSVRYGGLLAVDEVSIAGSVGEIVGIIGPNGAGKTSLFNACSGLIRPANGQVRYSERNITSRSVPWRARHGLGRTFQHLALFDSMTVEENVRLGREGAMAGTNPWRITVSRRGDRTAICESADEAIEMCQLDGLRGARVADLPAGTRRLVELARCLAGRFEIMLLDEPSAGLNSVETQLFGETLLKVVRDGRRGIILVEHDMTLVMAVCSHIYVLEFGKLVFEGAPEAVRASPVVQAAYLGEEAMT